MMNECDVVVIGAGHNGLTCAAYLARAGLKVRVVERRPVVGGAAVNGRIPSRVSKLGRSVHRWSRARL
jgi:phytoene dehydrogenase-like protein